MAAFLSAGADVVFTKPLRRKQLTALFEYVEVHGSRSQTGKKLRLVVDCIEVYSF